MLTLAKRNQASHGGAAVPWSRAELLLRGPALWLAARETLGMPELKSFMMTGQSGPQGASSSFICNILVAATASGSLFAMFRHSTVH